METDNEAAGCHGDRLTFALRGRPPDIAPHHVRRAGPHAAAWTPRGPDTPPAAFQVNQAAANQGEGEEGGGDVRSLHHTATPRPSGAS